MLEDERVIIVNELRVVDKVFFQSIRTGLF